VCAALAVLGPADVAAARDTAPGPTPMATSMPGMDDGSMPGMDGMAGMDGTAGMDDGSMAGMDGMAGMPAEPLAESHPRALVLGGFAGVDVLVMVAAAVLRRRTATGRRRRRPHRPAPITA
jgi:uncharacterized protein involved in copper resistance